MLILHVHGTRFSEEKGMKRDSCYEDEWCHPESAFSKDLKAFVAYQGRAPRIQSFIWSGDNRGAVRRRHGRTLAGRIRQLEKEGEPYYIVCHSHGGSVCVIALFELFKSKKPLKHLVGISTFGTPFIHMERDFFKERVLGVPRAVLSALGLTGLAAIAYRFLIVEDIKPAELTVREVIDRYQFGDFYNTPFIFSVLAALWIVWTFVLRLREPLTRRINRRQNANVADLQNSEKFRSFFHLDDEVIWWLLPLDNLTRDRSGDGKRDGDSVKESFTELGVRMIADLLRQRIKKTIFAFFFGVSILILMGPVFVSAGASFPGASLARLPVVYALGAGALTASLAWLAYTLLPSFSETNFFRKWAETMFRRKLRLSYGEHVLGLTRNISNFRSVGTGWGAPGTAIGSFGDHSQYGTEMYEAANNNESQLIDSFRNLAYYIEQYGVDDAVARIVASRGLIHNCYFESRSAAALIASHVEAVFPEATVNKQSIEEAIGSSEANAISSLYVVAPNHN